jgi:amino acid transporter
MDDNPSLFNRLKTLILGRSRSLEEQGIFHKLSLIAFFAWIGLGADGISSSCYGPPEAFLVLGQRHFLGIFVALGTVLTIFVISNSYSQIIELFPAGGGGYQVATHLLSPQMGMLSGCALLIDYVLTIAVSVSSGADALFSFFPASWYSYRLFFAAMCTIVLMLLNMRGVKESVIPLVPIFLVFILTHLLGIGYAFFTHVAVLPEVAAGVVREVRTTSAELGFLGMILLILKSYSMGAGTFTGIEAVSNGMPILRDPKVQTAKRTMRYMAWSLSIMVVGLIVSYLLYRVQFQYGKTLNAVLFGQVTSGWGVWGKSFLLLTLISEAILLFVAAQTGFLDGPRVLSNMAVDRWVPTRFTNLSDRLVTQNGILIMGVASIILIIATGGSVRFLVVLYSINVFITFSLSQLGMVRHWWKVRTEFAKWKTKLAINGVGLAMTTFILVSVVALKFHEGGWITLLVTGTLMAIMWMVKKHYTKVARLLRRLDNLVVVTELPSAKPPQLKSPAKTVRTPAPFDQTAKTAVLFVNGFNGLGLHTLFFILRKFENTFKNFVFVQVGVVNAGNFKSPEEIQRVEQNMKIQADRYVKYMQEHGYSAESISKIGVDVTDEITALAPKILERFPHAIFFGGQLVFSKDSFLLRALHNYTIFSIQRNLHYHGIPVIIMPIRVY